MQFHIRKRRPPAIQIVSLIDILSILLIFFIVTTQFKKSEPELNIQLPESSTAKESESENSTIVLHATEDQKIFLGKKEVSLDSLLSEIGKLKSAQPQANFAFKADERVPLGFFVKVLDISQEAGLSNVNLFTQPPSQPPAP